MPSVPRRLLPVLCAVVAGSGGVAATALGASAGDQTYTDPFPTTSTTKSATTTTAPRVKHPSPHVITRSGSSSGTTPTPTPTPTTSPSTTTTAPSGTGATTPQAGQLPRTGGDPGLVGGFGGVLLLAGAGLRLRLRERGD